MWCTCTSLATVWKFGKHSHKEGKPLSRIMATHHKQMTGWGIKAQGLQEEWVVHIAPINRVGI